MPMNSETHATPMVYEFGPFRLEPGGGLSRGGRFVPLPPKELSLLETLVRAEGRVVDHDRILDEVWPQQEASWASLSRCVYALRRALGGDKGRYVATVPRRGYRLVVPVRRVVAARALSVIEKSIQTSPRAYSDYLQGLREANLGGPEHQARAVQLFHSAHGIDPNYAVPLGAVADCRMYQLLRGYVHPTAGERLGRQACAQALAIDPDLVSARAALGWFEGVVRRRTDSGLALVDQALRLDPDYARAYAYRGWILRMAGRLDQSVAEMRAAVERDPHSILNTHALAWSLFCAGEWEEALEIERRVVRDTPQVEVGHVYVAVMGSWLGFHREAVAAGRRAVEICHRDPSVLTTLTYALARSGEHGAAHALAEQARAVELPRAVRPHLAMTYAALGDAERVVALLREARDEGCPWFGGARYDPRLEDLADHPAVLALYGGERDRVMEWAASTGDA
jgi:DNA-binding winged helix-turn-helix (wHTH) protein/Flp pilus assembly protein TadD